MAVETTALPQRRTEVAPAIACILVGTAVLTLNDALIKSLANSYPTGQLLFIRGIFVWPWILLFAMRMGGLKTLRIRNIKGQALRGVCVIASAFLFITGLRYLTLADAIAVSFTGPLFITAMAPLVLGEKVGWRRWLAVLVGFAGVLFMLRPGGSALQWAIIFPLGAAVCGGMRDLITRRIAGTEMTVAVLAATTTVVLVAGLATAPFVDWVPVRPPDIAMFAVSGTLIAFAHTLMIEAFRRGEAALVAPFKYSSLLWATLIGYLAFGELPDRWTIVGAVIIVLAGLYVLHRETQLRQRQRAVTGDGSAGGFDAGRGTG
ncbi:MAG: DMT family transporter, partial [Alphaproteobacteria bacterium]|nr:DMT family transporter [Alphaproteobacteria bacterium]